MAEKSDTTETIEVVEKVVPAPKKTVKKAEPKPVSPPPAPKKNDEKWKELGFRSQAAYQKFLDKGL